MSSSADLFPNTAMVSRPLLHPPTLPLLTLQCTGSLLAEGVAPGNEKGYLVSANSCQFSHADPSLPTPPRLKLSDPMRVVARYDSTVARGAVMAMFTMQFADPPSGAL